MSGGVGGAEPIGLPPIPISLEWDSCGMTNANATRISVIPQESYRSLPALVAAGSEPGTQLFYVPTLATSRVLVNVFERLREKAERMWGETPDASRLCTR